MKSYLFAVQRQDGVEVVSIVADVQKVSDVSAIVLSSGEVQIGAGDEVLVSGYAGADTPDLVLCRWPAENLTAKPVVKKLIRG